MPPGTALRNLRVEDELWRAALNRATERGEPLSEAIRRFLREYVAK